MRRLFVCHHCSHSNFSQHRCPRPRSMWQPRSLRNSFDSKSGSLSPAIPTGSIARFLVFSVSSLPKRKVMAFASWICCVLRHHLRVKHLFPFVRVFSVSPEVFTISEHHVACRPCVPFMPFSPLAVINVRLARDIIAAHPVLLITGHPLLSPQLP